MRDLPRTSSDVRFPDRLQRIHTLGILLPDLHNLAKRALPDDLE